MLVLGGKAFDALENQQKAVQWLVAALEVDAHCYEAFKVWQTSWNSYTRVAALLCHYQ